MANVDDVAAAVLKKTGTIDTFKFQKLVCYCQAWHLVWESTPLFSAKVEAWANGPVVPKLYQRHLGSFSVSGWKWGDRSKLGEPERTTVAAVVKFYGERSGQELAELTHRERPWKEARAGLPAGTRGNAVITLEAMSEYYGSLL